MTRSDGLLNANPMFFALLMQEYKEECNLVVFESWFAAATQGRIKEIIKLLKGGFKVDRKTEILGEKVYTALI